MDTVIYHNNRCSKSRATMALLEQNNISPTTIYYLETPPSVDELDSLLNKLNKQPEEIIRFGESIAKELKISAKDKRTRSQWIELMVQHPILIERPIVVMGDKAVLGRPPENVLTLIEEVKP